MRKNVFGRRLKRDTKERKALFKGLLSSLVLHERIRTTEQKAKAIRSEADKLITKARIGGQNAERLLSWHLTPVAMEKLLTDTVKRFEKRQGGYTRIIRTGRRFNDNATMVIMEWVEIPTKSLELKVESSKSREETGKNKNATAKTQKTKKARRRKLVSK